MVKKYIPNGNKRIAELPLDKTDVKRLETMLKELKKTLKKGFHGCIFPLRAIEHYKKDGSIDWVDDWELCDNWEGVRKRV